MGDFDKNQAAPKPGDQKRKQILVGALGVVLLGVVSFHFLKGSPEHASAAMITADGNGQGLAVTDSPRGAIAKLDSDPTANLLLGAATLDPDLAAVPHDPFMLSERMRPLVAKSDLKPLTHEPEPPPKPVIPKPEAPAIPANSLKLEGIMRMAGPGGGKLAAIVNGSILLTGQTIGNAMIMEIHEDGIIVRHKDWPGGPTTTLTIQPKLK